LSSLAIDEPAPALGNGDHCREMAGKLRQLARYTKSPGIRRELVGLAKRYNRRGEYISTATHARGTQPSAVSFGCGTCRRTSFAGLSSRNP